MEKRALFLIFLTSVISGFAIFINKFGVSVFDASFYTFMKNIVAAFFLVTVLFFTKEYKDIKKITGKDFLKLTAIGIIGGGIPFLLFFNGLKLTTAANASLIHKSMFIFVGILAFLFFKERLGKTLKISIALLFAGVVLFYGINGFAFNYGSILVFIATLFWAAEIILSKNILKGRIKGTTVAFFRLFIGSFFILAYLFVNGSYKYIFELNMLQLKWLLITAALLAGYVFTFYNGLKYTSPTIATSILLFGSVITTSLDFIFIKGSILPAELFGMVAICAGLSFILANPVKVYQQHKQSV